MFFVFVLFMVHGLWFFFHGLWFMVYGLWFMFYGLWFMVYGLWFMVYGLWFMFRVNPHTTITGGHVTPNNVRISHMSTSHPKSQLLRRARPQVGESVQPHRGLQRPKSGRVSMSLSVEPPPMSLRIVYHR